MSTEMTQTKTERGFPHVSFKDFYEIDCHIQISSLATEECIWLGADNIGLKEFVAYRQPNAWVDVELEHTQEHHYVANNCMHLSREQVLKLLPYLQRFAQTGNLY